MVSVNWKCSTGKDSVYNDGNGAKGHALIGLNSRVRLAFAGGAYPIWGYPDQVVFVESWWVGVVVAIEAGIYCAVDFRQYCSLVVVIPLTDLMPAEQSNGL
jgi:hypothetical protein